MSMSCEEFATLTSSAMENRTKLRDRLRMLWHKIICVYCRRFMRQLQQIRTLLRAGSKSQPMPVAMKTTLARNLKDAG